MARRTVERVQQVVARALTAAGCPRQAVLLVAVSGGQDSLCLLHALGPAITAFDGRLIVVHVDHRLRGAASAADAELVESTAAALGHEPVRVSVDVADYAARAHLGLEAAGRYARYRALAALAAARRAWAAATGHTRDDRTESLLINIVRGSGPLGLTSLHPHTFLEPGLLGPPLRLPLDSPEGNAAALRVLRPLLSIGRSETAAYCRAAGLAVRRDASNLDPRFLRNRVRHHLLPLLKTYNPSVGDSLARLAEITADDEVELDRLAASAWRETVDATPGAVEVAWPAWGAHSSSIQRRLLRRVAAHLGQADGWSFRSLEDARLLLADRPPRRRLALGGGVSLETSRRGFVLRGPSDARRDEAATAPG